MLTFIANHNDTGKRIDNFLFKVLPDCPKSVIYRTFRKKDIKINGKRAGISDILKCGDIITAFLPADITPAEIKASVPDFMKASKNLRIIYEDENILIADKPAGLICHSDNKSFGDTLVDRVKRYLYDKKEYTPENENSFAPALCNRIDRNTCGLVIAAKNASALHYINEKIRSREISKYYYCLVHGVMPSLRDILRAYISKDNDKNIVSVSQKPDEGKSEIITEYTVISSSNDYSLLEIHLITGRTHQIRAHLAYIGHPVAGDPKYGLKNKNSGKLRLPYQALCSRRLCFDFNDDDSFLSYLKGKEFITENIWFLK